MRARVGLVFALVALAIGGCGGKNPVQSADPAVSGVTTSPAPSQSSASPIPTQSPPEETTPTTKAPPRGDVLIEYGRQGGLKGADDHLVVRRDGTYTLTRRARADVTGKLTATELAGLNQALAASHFDQIPHVNHGNTITDGYTYRVVYQGREVLAEDGGIPVSLENVVDALNVVISHAG
jgi:hypothetical protein